MVVMDKDLLVYWQFIKRSVQFVPDNRGGSGERNNGCPAILHRGPYRHQRHRMKIGLWREVLKMEQTMEFITDYIIKISVKISELLGQHPELGISQHDNSVVR